MFPCKRKKCENQNFCYFYHKHETDKRRQSLDFHEFFSRYDSNKTITESFCLNQLKNYLKFYCNETGYSNKFLNGIFIKYDGCLNIWEKNFHIKNYLEKQCKFDAKEILIPCPNKLFCSDFHSKDKLEKNKENIYFHSIMTFDDLSK